MARLLYIQASPRQDRSYSRAVADQFIESYRNKNSHDQIVTIDLFRAELPQFDALAVEAKFAAMHGEKQTGARLEVWNNVELIIDEFKSADKYLFAVAMWNFGIPYRLKQYIDILVQPGHTFSYSPDKGYTGLVTGKPATVVYARGGEYRSGSPLETMDFQKSYFETILGFIGFKDIRSILVEQTMSPQAQVHRDEAIGKAKEMASTF